MKSCNSRACGVGVRSGGLFFVLLGADKTAPDQQFFGLLLLLPKAVFWPSVKTLRSAIRGRRARCTESTHKALRLLLLLLILLLHLPHVCVGPCFPVLEPATRSGDEKTDNNAEKFAASSCPWCVSPNIPLNPNISCKQTLIFSTHLFFMNGSTFDNAYNET